MTRVLVITPDRIGVRMAGPAIRAMAIGRALAAAGHEVTVASTGACTLQDPQVRTVLATGDRQLKPLVARSDVVVIQGWTTANRPWLLASDRVLVFDLYDPIHLELLEQARSEGEANWWGLVNSATTMTGAQLRRGDFFLCASDRQRALWLGQLTAEGRVNPANYAADPALRSLIDVVPFGTGDTPPTRSGPGLRGVVPGIGAGDKVVLWGGGVYDWLDPLTVVRAVDRVRHDVPEVRLVFLGMRHPSGIPEMSMAAATRVLSDELGLTGSVVFFNEQWVPYDDRANYLLDADVAVTAHQDHVETAFSFRTRVLDYLWAGLPVLTTGGDALGDLVHSEQLGVTVPAGDVGLMAEGMRRLLADTAFTDEVRARIHALQPTLTWQAALAPLLRFCAAPAPAADRTDPRRRRHRAMARMPRPDGLRGTLFDLGLARQYLLEGGPSLVAERARSRVRRVAEIRRADEAAEADEE